MSRFLLVLLCVMLFDGHALADRETAWWPLVDTTGDVVALCDVDGSTPRVAGQWSYEPYGQAVAAESIHAHPQMKLGHKGLFLDRLDLDSLSPSSGGVWPTLLAPSATLLLLSSLCSPWPPW